MRFPFWRSHHSLLLLEKEKRGRKETCIRTCRKMQEVLGFSFTHSTILSHFTPRYCKLQSTQLLSPNLLCHPQRPAPNFHPVKQCKKKNPSSLKEVNSFELKICGMLGGCTEDEKGKVLDSGIRSVPSFWESKKYCWCQEESKSQPCLGECSNGSSRAGRKLFSELKWENVYYSVKELGNLQLPKSYFPGKKQQQPIIKKKKKNPFK